MTWRSRLKGYKHTPLHLSDFNILTSAHAAEQGTQATSCHALTLDRDATCDHGYPATGWSTTRAQAWGSTPDDCASYVCLSGAISPGRYGQKSMIKNDLQDCSSGPCLTGKGTSQQCQHRLFTVRPADMSTLLVWASCSSCRCTKHICASHVASEDGSVGGELLKLVRCTPSLSYHSGWLHS